jgi:hypothetical protein
MVNKIEILFILAILLTPLWFPLVRLVIAARSKRPCSKKSAWCYSLAFLVSAIFTGYGLAGAGGYAVLFVLIFAWPILILALLLDRAASLSLKNNNDGQC